MVINSTKKYDSQACTVGLLSDLFNYTVVGSHYQPLKTLSSVTRPYTPTGSATPVLSFPVTTPCTIPSLPASGGLCSHQRVACVEVEGEWACVQVEGEWVCVQVEGEWVCVQVEGEWGCVQVEGEWVCVQVEGEWVCVQMKRRYMCVYIPRSEGLPPSNN